MTRRRARPEILARVGELAVVRDPRDPSGRLLQADGMDASYVDLSDPRHIEFDYLRWMGEVLRLVSPRRVLHIGGGGCALARALLAGDRSSHHDVCESSQAVLALAREHLGLRRGPGLRVRHVEGRAFLSRCPADAYDAVVVDAFVGARVPRQLVTVEGARELARVAPLALVNVLDARSGAEVGRIGAALRQGYRERAPASARVFALGGRGGNTVLAACAVPELDLVRLTARLAADRAPARLTEPAELAPRLDAAAPLRD